jgi:hypothetical protein
MPNLIKYSVGATPVGCLRKGNMLIGNNTADYGSTFFNGIDPPTGGYTIYLNKASQGPSIYCPENDAKLIERTNQIAGASYTTVAQCLAYFAGQTDKIVVKSNYEGIVTSGLVLNLDAGFLPSYPTTGTTWYDVSGNNSNGILTNGPTFSSANSGTIVFDGTNDYADFIAPGLGTTTTVEMWCKIGAAYSGRMFFGWDRYDVWCGSGTLGFNTAASDVYGISASAVSALGLVNNWKHYTFEMRSDVAYTNNKIYINGASQTLSQQLSSENASVRNFNSGNGRIAIWRATETSFQMPMECAIFKVYNRALTQNEITQNYNTTKARFGL